MQTFFLKYQCTSSCSPSIGTYYRNLVSQCNRVIYISIQHKDNVTLHVLLNVNFDRNLADVLDILEHFVLLFEMIKLGQICFGHRRWPAILSMLDQHVPNQGFIFMDQIENEPKLFGSSKIRNILKFRINKVSICYWKKKKQSIYLELTKGKDLAQSPIGRWHLSLLCATHMIT